MEPQYQFGEEQTFWDKFKSNFAELIEFVAVAGAILVIVRFFVAEPHRVDGSSMVPNFHNNDYLLTNKLSLRFGELQRGEVVILKSPLEPLEKVFIKRIVGLPNERLKIVGGKVYINSQVLDEPYLPQGITTETEGYMSEGEEITIPEESYFVLGDNRSGSSDSRQFGPIKRATIIGQSLFRYWPPQKFMFIKIGGPSW